VAKLAGGVYEKKLRTCKQLASDVKGRKIKNGTLTVNQYMADGEEII
jgi:hypothetical protein